jgi:hypothetical protein
VNRAAVFLAALALVLASGALVAALDHPSPLARFPIQCAQAFRAVSGQQSVIFYPCRRVVQP